MNKSLLEILACPMDKHHPLELYGAGGQEPVESGALYCTECSRFYLIIDGIPVMLPDDLRDRSAELDAIRNIDGLPDKILRRGRPWNLSSA